MAKNRFEGVNVGPDIKRLQRVFIRQMTEAMQEYVDECDMNINLQADGQSFVLPLEKAAELFNDFLLYCNMGEDLTLKVNAGEIERETE